MTAGLEPLDPDARPMWSGWALRSLVDFRVSDEQLDGFAKWGLLTRQGSGYGPGADRQLERILAAANEARSLPRRVVLLRADHTLFPVPAESLRRALIEMAPTVRAGARMLRRVATVWEVMGDRAAGRSGRPTRPRRLPPQSWWPDLLAAISVQRVDVWATGWYFLARDVLPLYGRECGTELDSIPIEERVLMVAILDTRGSGPT